MDRSLIACLAGTFTLRFSTGLTGVLLGFYFVELTGVPGTAVGPVVVGLMAASFFAAELLLSPPFGILSDHVGHHRVMQLGPVFGAVAVILTGFTRGIAALGGVLLLPVLAFTRILEGASTAASVPSILGYIAMVTAGDEQLRGRSAALFEAATLGGFGVGFIVAPKLFEAIGVTAFFLNALIYGGSFLIYRYGVADPRGEAELLAQEHPDSTRKYLALLSNSRVLLLAPTWIAVNAAIGLWVSQSIFQFAKRDDRFPEQLLHRGVRRQRDHPGRHRDRPDLRGGPPLLGQPLQDHAPHDDHPLRHHRRRRARGQRAGGQPPRRLPLALAVDLRGRRRRGACSCSRGRPRLPWGCWPTSPRRSPTTAARSWASTASFWPSGQIAGSLIGGVAADLRGIDGLLVATLILLAVALVPLFRLRGLEHVVGAGGEVSLSTEAPSGA